MAKANFKRIEDSSTIDDIDIEDGAFIVTGDGKTYVDFGTNRIPTSGTPDSQMSNTSRNTVENKVIKEYVDDNLTNFMNKPILLWENQDPYTVFNEQQITLNSDDYDMLCIIATSWNRAGYRKSVSVITSKNISGLLQTQFVSDIGEMYIGTRVVEYIDDTHFTVRNALGVGGQSITTVRQNNEVLIPRYIIGYKTNLTFE